MEVKAKFVHLNFQSEFSLLNSLCKITHGETMKFCLSKKMDALAITDEGNMYGAYIFYNNASRIKSEEFPQFKCIMGTKVYVANNRKEEVGIERISRLVLLAETQEGYKNLIKISSKGFLESSSVDIPKVDLNVLKEHSEGVICLTGGYQGEIYKRLVNFEFKGAREYLETLIEIYGHNNVFVEIQRNEYIDENINARMIELAEELKLGIVATNMVCFLEKDQIDFSSNGFSQDSSNMFVSNVIAMQSLNKMEKVRKFIDPISKEQYMKTAEEMIELFKDYPEAIANTVKIANRCNVSLKKKNLFPKFSPPNGMTPDEYLIDLAYKGIEKKYGKITNELDERAKYELDVITKMGFSEYYLIVRDFIMYAKNNGIPVGPGRGSGVGSIVAYAVGITNVDPLRHHLIFDRFLNPERISNPDFDIDFCFEGREKVIKYVVDKYGEDKVCQIIAFGTLAPKAAFKNVASVNKMPYTKANNIAKNMDDKKPLLEQIGKKADKNKEFHPIEEIKNLYDTDDEFANVINIASKVEGLPKNTTKHAAGVVICSETISDNIPQALTKDNYITTQFPKADVEELGMLKMDFLGLKTLTDIDKAKKYVKLRKNIDIDFDELGVDDKNVFKLIASGDTDAVFQCESAGMKDFMKRLEPSDIEEIIAGISLYRPGPMDSIDEFIHRKKNPKTIKYDHPLLEPILKVTNGLMVYQEQVMQIVRDLAGYSLGGSDLLRRIMGKKDAELMKKQKQIFLYGAEAQKAIYHPDGTIKEPAKAAIEGAVNRNVDAAVAEDIFNKMQSFASYAFNKSHAAAYAYLSYQTAYMKLYHMVDYITAVLNNRMADTDDVKKYISYLLSKGVELLPVSINKSFVDFFVEDDKHVRFAFCAVKGVGTEAAKAIVAEREENGDYKSFTDFLYRIDKQYANKKLLESLIQVGAFDEFNLTRRSLLEQFQDVMRAVDSDKKEREEYIGALNIFDNDNRDYNDSAIKYKEEFDKIELLALENKLSGVFLSGNPLDKYIDLITSKFNLSKIYKNDSQKETYVFSDEDGEQFETTIDVTIIDEEENIEENVEKESVDNNGGDSTNEKQKLIGKINPKILNKTHELICIIDAIKAKRGKNGKFFVCRLIDIYDNISAVFYPSDRNNDVDFSVFNDGEVVSVKVKFDIRNGFFNTTIYDIYKLESIDKTEDVSTKEEESIFAISIRQAVSADKLNRLYNLLKQQNDENGNKVLITYYDEDRKKWPIITWPNKVLCDENLKFEIQSLFNEVYLSMTNKYK